MNLFQEYRNQQNWRNWSKYIEHLPISPLQSVLDLGSSVGGFANEISGNVAMVTGLDINQEFVDFCQSNARINQKFVCADISQYDFSDAVPFDGAWSSFSLSYLREPESVVRNLHSRMNNFGWIALVDVSCFLSGNMSRSSRFYSRVRNFELKSGSSGGYDFNFGSKMESLLSRCGFDVFHHDPNIHDLELNFNGAAGADILENWKARLSRIKGLKIAFPDEYEEINHDILENLQSELHVENGNVRFVVGRKSNKQFKTDSGVKPPHGLTVRSPGASRRENAAVEP